MNTGGDNWVKVLFAVASEADLVTADNVEGKTWKICCLVVWNVKATVVIKDVLHLD